MRFLIPLWCYDNPSPRVDGFRIESVSIHNSTRLISEYQDTFYWVHPKLPKINFNEVKDGICSVAKFTDTPPILNNTTVELSDIIDNSHILTAYSSQVSNLILVDCIINEDGPLVGQLLSLMVSSAEALGIDSKRFKFWLEKQGIAIDLERFTKQSGDIQNSDKCAKPMEKLGRAAAKLAKPLEEASRAINLFGADLEANLKERKEKENSMANLFGDIKVGKAGSNYSITYFGTIAYKGKTYHNGTIYDAQGMTINFDMLYLVPSTEVKKGDIIDKGNKAYYVLEVNNGVVKAVNLVDGTEENLVPGGLFGMTMYSKVFNPMGNMQGENAFGNVLMMQALCGDGNLGSGDNGMLLAMMMMQGGFKFPTFTMPTATVAEKK